MNQDSAPPDQDSSLNTLFKLLLIVLQKLSDQIFVFIIAVFIVALIAYLIGGLDLIIQLKVFFLLLAIVGVIAVVVSTFGGSNNPTSRAGGVRMSDNSIEAIQFLTKWVDSLTRVEFERMIHELLLPSEEVRLSKPVSIIDASSFLNDMRFFWGNLDKVRSYLDTNYSTRRPE